jgi:hypothetical protein
LGFLPEYHKQLVAFAGIVPLSDVGCMFHSFHQGMGCDGVVLVEPQEQWKLGRASYSVVVQKGLLDLGGHLKSSSSLKVATEIRSGVFVLC